MAYILPILVFVGGIVLGSLVIWLAARRNIQHVRALAEAESNQKNATLHVEVSHLKQLLDEAKETAIATDAELAGEKERRASAEERCTRIQDLETDLQAKGVKIDKLLTENAQLQSTLAETQARAEEERKATEEKLRLLTEAKDKFETTFKALSSDALKSNNSSFLELAKTILERFQETAKGDLEKRQQAIAELVNPVRQSLEKVDAKIHDLEKARTGAYEGLTQQVRGLLETQHQLRSETANLVKALRAPAARGRWGEIQLKRVVEMAGMVKYCTYEEQASVTTEDGRLRPDLVVRLPAEKNVVVDAKVPLTAYLDALETQDDNVKISKLKEHARQVRDHISALSRKAYWDQFQPAPEFVVLFLPAETFFSAALEHDPDLIEAGVEHRVILATPTTLIALLRAVAYGWRQENVAQNAQEISALGRELYKRISDLADHWAKLGNSLETAVGHYNRAVGSLEARVLVSARRFRDLEAAPPGTDISDLNPVEQIPRSIQAVEFQSTEVKPDDTESGMDGR